MPLSAALFDDNEAASSGRRRAGLFGDNDSDDDLALLRASTTDEAPAAEKTSPDQGDRSANPWGGFDDGAFEFLRPGQKSSDKKDANSSFSQKVATYAASTAAEEDLWPLSGDDPLKQLNLPAVSSVAELNLPAVSSTAELNLPAASSVSLQDKSPCVLQFPMTPTHMVRASVTPGTGAYVTSADKTSLSEQAPAAPAVPVAPVVVDSTTAVDMDVDSGAVMAPAVPGDVSPALSAAASALSAAAAPAPLPAQPTSLPGPWCILDLPNYALPEGFKVTLLPRAGSGKPGPWRELRELAKSLVEGMPAKP